MLAGAGCREQRLVNVRSSYPASAEPRRGKERVPTRATQHSICTCVSQQNPCMGHCDRVLYNKCIYYRTQKAIQIQRAKTFSNMVLKKRSEKAATATAAKSLQSCPTLCNPKETAAHQAPPSLGFSKQEYWSGLPFPSPEKAAKGSAIFM